MKNDNHLIDQFKSGHFEKGVGFKYFVPNEINKEWVTADPILLTLLEKASIKLGGLNSFSKLVPNLNLFIQLHVLKEAVISSRIEGTQTNIDEALLPVEEVDPKRKNDWLEVHNYTMALNESIELLKTLPLSSRLLREAHRTLLSGVRGEHKMPGEFRTSQNWIGGASLNDAVFIPPAKHFVDPLMGDLENFLHNTDIHVPSLIRIGIAHYQFETIHPFLDGNGRIGRLMITLFLVSEGILDVPLLYLSTFFEKNKSLYYDNLTNVREKDDMLQWLKYFLIGIEETSTIALNTLSTVLQLKTKLEIEAHSELGRRAPNGLKLLHELFKTPIVSVKEVETICDLSTKAANDLVKLLQEKGWLTQLGGSVRYRFFTFSPYLNLFK
ncbi:MAG: Fic family protein [Bacteroidota bacterium]